MRIGVYFCIGICVCMIVYVGLYSVCSGVYFVYMCVHSCVLLCIIAYWCVFMRSVAYDCVLVRVCAYVCTSV